MNEVVFLGGATLGFFIDVDSTENLRATKDVDFIVEISNTTEMFALESKLRHLGFLHDTSEGSPICRYILNVSDDESVSVDIMPTGKEAGRIINRWYKEAIKNIMRVKLSEEISINILTAPYKDRGDDLPTLSHDLEDVLLIFRKNKGFLEQCRAQSAELRRYLSTELSELQKHSDYEDMLTYFILDPTPEEVIALAEQITLLTKLV